jgi:predicted nucleotidyltransferase
VRSSSSSVLKWPDRDAVEGSLREWAAALAVAHTSVLRVGFFGSYARGDWGVGSDLDVLVIVERTDAPFERRSLLFDTLALPVPTDLLVYTPDEVRSLQSEAGRFARVLTEEAVWVFARPSGAD